MIDSYVQLFLSDVQLVDNRPESNSGVKSTMILLRRLGALIVPVRDWAGHLII
jgi:hypothetical protein